MVCEVAAVASYSFAQEAPRKDAEVQGTKEYVVLLKRGPQWIPNKPAAQQALSNHGHYLNEEMSKGVLVMAGPFLDGLGGLILYRGKSEAEVRAIAEHDPGVVDQILAIESIHPFQVAFDAATGKSPFARAK